MKKSDVDKRGEGQEEEELVLERISLEQNLIVSYDKRMVNNTFGFGACMYIYERKETYLLLTILF